MYPQVSAKNWNRCADFLSNMDSLIVCNNLFSYSLALDTPHYAPPMIFWEVSDAPQGLAKHEIIPNIIPKFVAECEAIRSVELDSALNVRKAGRCFILSGSEVARDFGGLDEPIPSVKFEYYDVVVGHNDLGFEVKEQHKRLRPEHNHRRRMTRIDENGFRQNLISTKEIIRPVGKINANIFGITQRGASKNNCGVNGRTIWHSKQRCMEQLCRQRTPFDFLDAMKSKKAGFCDARA